VGVRWATERKRKLDGRILEYRCQVVSWTPRAAVLLYRPGQEVDLAGLRLPADVLSYGLYWVDRPFNIYHWVDRDGRTLACYCNVSTDTHIGQHRVEWLDLELDVLVTPDGAVRVLDEDEVPANLSVYHRAQLVLASQFLQDGPAVLLLARASLPAR
jgi:predicted RNA-binding protein associated with RNAse of E/G family